jgi:hypothetical protein
VEAGISGIPRTREWDAVVTAECGSSGDTCVFAVVPGRGPLHLGADDAPLACLAAALEDVLEPPYRAVGIRHDGSTWAVGAVRIEVAELPADTEGEELMLTVNQEGERALEIDRRPTAEMIPALEEAAGGRYDAYFLRATRLDGHLWEIGIDPL